MSPRHQRMFALLTWLAGEEDTEKALERLLEAVPKDKRDGIKEKLQSSIEIYNLDREELDGTFYVKGLALTIKTSFVKTFFSSFFSSFFLLFWYFSLLLGTFFCCKSVV